MQELLKILNTGKVLITGGSGFIGTNLIDYLVNKGADVVNFDILPPRNEDQSSFYRCVDITDCVSLKKNYLEVAPKVVIHLAARTDLGGSKITDYSANVTGVENICRIISDNEFTSHVIFASSMLVCRVGIMPISDDEYHPTTIYGESKVLTEKIIRKYHNKLPDYKIVRPTSIWGPWFQEPYIDFFNMVLSGKYFNLGNKSCTKTYGYIGNAINQIVILLDPKICKGALYYLGDKNPVNIAVWANIISLKAKNKRVKTVPFFIFQLAAKLGDLLNKISVRFPMSTFRLKNMTTDNVIDQNKIPDSKFFHPVSLDKGVEETLEWMNNRMENIK